MKSKRHTIPATAEMLSLLFAIFVVLVIGLLAYRTWHAFGRRSTQLEISQRILSGTAALLSSLKDAETGQRGFLLTGEDHYLEPYRQALRDLPRLLASLSEVTGTRRPDQAARVDRLRPLIKEKLDELRETIELRRTQGLRAAIAVVETDRGMSAMNQIRALCGEMESAANRRLNQYSNEATSAANDLGLVSTAGSVALLVLLIAATITIRGGTRRREELIQSLVASEASIRESRDWLQTTLSSIGDAVITTDSSGRAIMLNGVAQALSGWDQEAASGRPLEEVFVIVNEQTGAPVENPVSKVLREGCVVGLANHTELIARDGRRIPIDDSAAPIRGPQGDIAGVVLVFRDITSRREAERRVEQGLEALRASNEALVRANEDLSYFAFAASHDLLEPLRTITSYSQLLLKDHEGASGIDASTCVQFITDGATRMRELLTDLLDYTQVTNEVPETAQVVDLNVTLQKALDNLEDGVHETSAIITSDRLPMISGHDPHFVQLFQNLVGNALKYHGHSTPKIHVSAAYEDGMCRIGVADNGIGVDPEYHDKIFGVFKRLHGRDIPGTGIGLAICRRVVERYGGRIWVESQVNQGATFCLTLPREVISQEPLS